MLAGHGAGGRCSGPPIVKVSPHRRCRCAAPARQWPRGPSALIGSGAGRVRAARPGSDLDLNGHRWRNGPVLAGQGPVAYSACHRQEVEQCALRLKMS